MDGIGNDFPGNPVFNPQKRWGSRAHMPGGAMDATSFSTERVPSQHKKTTSDGLVVEKQSKTCSARAARERVPGGEWSVQIGRRGADLRTARRRRSEGFS